VEKIAKRTGAVVAIGHPRDITLRDLKAWIPTLEAKGYQLAPLTAVLQYRAEKEKAREETEVARPKATSSAVPAQAEAHHASAAERIEQ
jgi:hypothetical protein